MAKQRRQYTQEYKREAVRFLEETGRPVREVAAELQLTEQILGKWRKQFGSGVSPGPLSPSEAEELRRLRRENEVLRQERDFLKKAAAYFANGSPGGTP
jgi:transposase